MAQNGADTMEKSKDFPRRRKFWSNMGKHRLWPGEGGSLDYRGRGEFCLGKLTLGKILPGKNSVPELKNGGNILSPRCLEGLKGNSARSAEEMFGLYFELMTRLN